ncbi:Protein of unknown function [Bacillus cereus]|nr:Protein of unknown function [Bacillus cereus]
MWKEGEKAQGITVSGRRAMRNG